jgi:hypothetical protein
MNSAGIYAATGAGATVPSSYTIVTNGDSVPAAAKNLNEQLVIETWNTITTPP